MKKIATVVISLLMIMGMAIGIQAAELNENEADIISKISGKRAEVEIEERYVNQLRNYFYQDGVDIGSSEAEEFVESLKLAVEEIEKLEDGVVFDEASNAYIALEKAATLIEIHFEYDSKVNGFYGIDYLGQIVIDPQPIIKDTDEEDSNAWNISIEIIFAIAIILCVLGLLVNAKRWNKKMKHRREKSYEDDDEEEDELEVANRKTRKARLKTMSYRSVQQVLKYFYIPIIMAAILIVTGFLLMMINADLRESISRSFINTQPLYTELTDVFEPVVIDEANQAESIDCEEIEWPSYGERYGTLQCEKLSIDAPVYYGDRGNVLVQGAGTYIGSSLPGFDSTILIGAHDTTYFAGLETVAVDDEFVFTTEYGIYRYKVSNIKIFDENSYDDGYTLNADTEQLVLYTCYPFGTLNGTKTERMFVYLDKVNGPKVN